MRTPTTRHDHDDLEEIEGMLAAATPGPWQTFPGNGILLEGRERRIVWPSDEAQSRSFCYSDICYVNPTECNGNGNADAALIAAAPTLIAALVAEVRRLRSLLVEQAA